MANSYDLIVIGAGPGGYVAAIRAAQLGLKTAIVEREHMAGICSNWGCIPTKALLRSAEVYGHMGHAKDYGLSAGDFGFDINAIVDRSRKIAGQMNNGVQFLMKKNKVDIIWGEAQLTAPGEIVVKKMTKKAVEPQWPQPKTVLPEGTYKAKNIIIATGARPRVLPGIEPDGEKIWTYFEAMKPAKFPRSLVIMGSGAIGMEFASFYRSLGAEVTVVELLPTILPVEDAEIAAHVKKRFEKRGIKIITDAKVTKVDKTADEIVAHVELKSGEKSQLSASALISAVGVQCNTENLGSRSSA